MSRRLKSTPFARFLLAMLFIVPLAYFGASYYNGDDPVQLIKDKLGIEAGSTDEMEERATATEDTYDLREEVEALKERIKELEMENEALKEKVRRLEMNK